MVGVGGPVGWTYAVTNTGNVPLRWSVSDNLIAALTCPQPPLILPGSSFTCQAGAPATLGQYTNIGTVQGLTPSGQVVTDNDPANYFGVQGGIELKKFTNGNDADAAPGPFIPVGAPITWTYRVTNTGNGVLTSVVVRDLDGVAVTCPSSTLAVGASMTCTGAGTAAGGPVHQHRHRRRVHGGGPARRSTSTRRTTTAPSGTSTSRRAPTATTPTRRRARPFASGTP